MNIRSLYERILCLPVHVFCFRRWSNRNTSHYICSNICTQHRRGASQESWSKPFDYTLQKCVTVTVYCCCELMFFLFSDVCQNLETKLASCRDFVYDTSVSRPALPAGPSSPSGLEGAPDVQATSMSPPPQYDRWRKLQQHSLKFF